ncbi:MAG: hypothetical protein H6718_35955 [Polyangiaceae bacterium]|nr:hypothetical protein [Polyangiaceae bacterium]
MIRTAFRSLAWLCLTTGVLSTACNEDKASGSVASAKASAVAPSATAVPLTQSRGNELTGFEVAPGKFAIPVGPRLILEPGKGAGPVRFGATVETIERQMGFKCQDLSATFCGMTTAAIDFLLKDGKVNEIHVHRIQRPSSPARDGARRVYGVFNGRLIKDISMGQFRGLVDEALGKPLRVDKITEENAFGTYEIAHYAGVSLEFDHLKNNNNVLGGVILRPFDAPLPPVATKPLSVPPEIPASANLAASAAPAKPAPPPSNRPAPR